MKEFIKIALLFILIACIASVLASCSLAHTHTCGDWTITTEPTCTEEGEKRLLCETCGETVDTEIIPTLEHVRTDGKCEYCEIDMPSENLEFTSNVD